MDLVCKIDFVINLTEPVAFKILQILAETVHSQDDKLNI